MNRSAIAICLLLAMSSNAFCESQVVEKSNASGIAENIRILGARISNLEDKQGKEFAGKQDEMYSRFMDLTLDMIARENARQKQLDELISWTNLGGNVSAVFAHLFLLLGIGLGCLELRRAYSLRQRGLQESVEIQIGLEGAAIKSSMYGFLVFGASLVVYFAYLRFVYPITSVG